jgi:hypothetical protein
MLSDVVTCNRLLWPSCHLTNLIGWNILYLNMYITLAFHSNFF